MHIREMHRLGWILFALMLLGCGPRVEPEKIVMQRLSSYPGAVDLTTTTTEYVLVEFTTTDSVAVIRDHYRAQLPGFRVEAWPYVRTVDVAGDFQFLYLDGEEGQTIVLDIEPAGAPQQLVKVYIYARKFWYE